MDAFGRGKFSVTFTQPNMKCSDAAHGKWALRRGAKVRRESGGDMRKKKCRKKNRKNCCCSCDTELGGQQMTAKNFLWHPLPHITRRNKGSRELSFFLPPRVGFSGERGKCADTPAPRRLYLYSTVQWPGEGASFPTNEH